MKHIASNSCAALLLSLGLCAAITRPAQAHGGGGSHGGGMAGMSRGYIGSANPGAIATPMMSPRLGTVAAPTMPGSTLATAVVVCSCRNRKRRSLRRAPSVRGARSASGGGCIVRLPERC